jgi:hypothetical protein
MVDLDKINGALRANDETEIPSAFHPHVKSFLGSLCPTLTRSNPSCPVQARHRLYGSAFSHVGDNVFVDVSGRRQRLSGIKAVAVGEALVKRAAHLNCHGVRVYLVFAFADALTCWEYNPDQYEVVYEGYVDKATPKIKSSASVSTEYLTTIITKEDADREPEESHGPGIHHVQTVPQATAEDA